MKILLATVAIVAVGLLSVQSRGASSTALYPALEAYLAERVSEFELIDDARRAQLDVLGDYVREQVDQRDVARLLFVCTRNSRRSHMTQLWAAAAAAAHGLPVATYSGGIEVSAFNPRAVTAIEESGFRVEKTTEGSNPIYHVRMSDQAPALTCFSKRYENAPNPRSGFAAVMVCADADLACPFVPGADLRIAVPFVDPKAHDNTDEEAGAYAERCAQIAREMMYVFRRAASAPASAAAMGQ